MAKIVKCPFCGKEMQDKFFGGETAYLSVGPSNSIVCCQDCHDKYDGRLGKEEAKRFESKLENITCATRKKFSNQDLAEQYLTYLKEMDVCKAARGMDDQPTRFNVFYGYNENRFWAQEFKLGLANESIGARDMVKARKQAEKGLYTTPYFTKDDITKLEFHIQNVSVVSMTTWACSFDVRLNDEKQMTYRPTILRGAFSFTGLIMGKRKAIKQVTELMEEFKRQIGSDLPIVMVKKMR